MCASGARGTSEFADVSTKTATSPNLRPILQQYKAVRVYMQACFDNHPQDKFHLLRNKNETTVVENSSFDNYAVRRFRWWGRHSNAPNPTPWRAKSCQQRYPLDKFYKDSTSVFFKRRFHPLPKMRQNWGFDHPHFLTKVLYVSYEAQKKDKNWRGWTEKNIECIWGQCISLYLYYELNLCTWHSRTGLSWWPSWLRCAI